ncbi:hypothetical protein ACB092_02G228100 [Castanea dentata]
MTKGRHSGLGNPLINANQIVTEAQKRWLHTAEICGILHNYKNFPLATKPANMPPSMTLNCIVWFAIIDLDFWTNFLFFLFQTPPCFISETRFH